MWNCSLVLDFQNSLPLSLLLQSKGSTELKSKEWCNVWHELKTDVSVCLFLWLMPLLREQGLLGVCRQVWPLTFGCRDSSVTRIFISSWLWGFASWRVRANRERDWRLWSPPLPRGPEVKLHLCCFTWMSKSKEPRAVAWGNLPVHLRVKAAYCCRCDRAVCRSKPGLGYWPPDFLEVVHWSAVVSGCGSTLMSPCWGRGVFSDHLMPLAADVFSLLLFSSVSRSHD